jgi:acylphosphatase
MDMKQVHLFISGGVQGVGFRFFVRDMAKRRGISGWVRNLSDGRVEALLQGEEKQLLEMIVLCRKGPSLAEVTTVDVVWEELGKKSVGFVVAGDK